MSTFTLLSVVFAMMITLGLFLVSSSVRSFSILLLSVSFGSLWILSIVGYLRYFTHVDAQILLCGAALLVTTKSILFPIKVTLGNKVDWLVTLAVVFLYTLVIAALAYNSILLQKPNIHVPLPTFVNWDAIVSYNRWAAEIFKFNYTPYNAFYPMAFPVIWSVFYDLQGHVNNWIIPKLSIVFTVLLLIVVSCHLPRACGLKPAALFVCSILILCIIPFQSFASGQMDHLVALLLFVGAFMHMWSSTATKDGSTVILTGSMCAFGLAMATKQSGFVALIPGVFALYTLRNRHGFTLNVYYLVLLFLPILLSAVMFFQYGGHPAGNLPYLKALSEINGASIASSFDLLSQSTHPFFIIVLFALGIYSCLKNSASGALWSLLYLILAIVGFLVFHVCCSYGSRNSTWIIALLLASICPLVFNDIKTPLEVPRVSGVKAITCAVSTALFAAGIGATADILYPFEKIDAQYRSLAVNQSLRNIIDQNLTLIEGSPVVLSYNQILGFVDPVMVGKHAVVSVVNNRLQVYFFGLEGRSGVCSSDNTCTREQLLDKYPDALFLLSDSIKKHPLIGSQHQWILENMKLELIDVVLEERLYRLKN